jgi:hypothetical protein
MFPDPQPSDRKMRPLRPPRDNRDIRKIVRFNTAEWTSVRAALDGAELSSTVRALLTGGKPKATKELVEAQWAVAAQLARIGNNLNQISHATHTGTGAAEILTRLIDLYRIAEKIAENADRTPGKEIAP